MNLNPQHLLSLPPKMAVEFLRLQKHSLPEWFATSDPPNSKLGSGGGIAHLLDAAWRTTGAGVSFSEWLKDSRKLLLMAGGQSRRLPAYAATGKILLPLKALRGAAGQRLDRTLLDAQMPAYQNLLNRAPHTARVMVTSGDVLLSFKNELPPLPEVDVLAFGMWVKPEVASHHGVFFSAHRTPNALAFFLQKPEPGRIRELSAEYSPLIDTGMWMLSERAIEVLMRRCGWNGKSFGAGVPDFYELYADFGLGLGSHPTLCDTEIGSLTSAVVALPDAEFYHLGTNRELIASASAFESRANLRTPGLAARQPHPDQHLLNASVALPLRREENHTLWIENSEIPMSWEIANEHILTGVPPNSWRIQLIKGRCLDFAPIGEGAMAIRPYQIDDTFKGPLGHLDTTWLGNSVSLWFERRGISFADAGLSADTDIQQARLFPVFPQDQLDEGMIQWLLDEFPSGGDRYRELWQKTKRLSAEEICNECNLDALYRQRREILGKNLPRFIQNNSWNAFYQLDLAGVAEELGDRVPDFEMPAGLAPLDVIHHHAFQAAVSRRKLLSNWQEQEAAAFGALGQLITREMECRPVSPKRNLLGDQIVWARSPIRLDIAGGWSDTPPYCFEHGGAVLNLAADINGQPPIQVFAKLSETPEIVIRSIDLGVEKRLRTYEDIDSFRQPDEFALARAALALAGFLPRFSTSSSTTLREQLLAFGGGLELNLLAATPKGSGLGTSSILSATVLGALGEVCGLGWDKEELFRRTLALEQLLTTGGGWQDQAGGLHPGIKLIETTAGFSQKPRIRWLSERRFEEWIQAGLVQLYYTGITRLAKNILQEIVRGLFLNSSKQLGLVNEIRAHAIHSFEALQEGGWNDFCKAVEKSWQLNQALDPGTNPPAVQLIIDQVADHLSAVKLLGAGGGGYMLFLAKDEDSGRRLRKVLQESPPHPNARFVDLNISNEGLAITRS